MVLNAHMPDQTTILTIQDTAWLTAEKLFGQIVPVDVLFMTHQDFIQMSEHTINHVAARARRDGIIMPRNTEDHGSGYNNEYNQNEDLEYQERLRRIADANLHYRDMHAHLNLGFEDKGTAFPAQQTLEHAMKALISALGEEYNTHHLTRTLAMDIRRLDKTQEWRFESNLGQLDNFAGGSRYGPTLSPIDDFREMANNITSDLDNIYQKIEAITGENPWSIPPDGTDQPVEPRWRALP